MYFISNLTTFAYWVIFMFYLSSADYRFDILFQAYHQSFKQFGSSSGQVGPDLGPNCLQRLLADDNCHTHIKWASIDVPRPLINDLWVFLFQKIVAECAK